MLLKYKIVNNCLKVIIIFCYVIACDLRSSQHQLKIYERRSQAIT